jgi:Predicted ATPase
MYINKVKLEKFVLESKREYPFNLPFIQHFSEMEFKNSVTFLVGENGTGKSTLLESIAVSYGFNEDPVTKKYSFSSMPTHSNLSDYITLTKGAIRPKNGYFLRAGSFYNITSVIDKLDEIDPLLQNKDSENTVNLHGNSYMSLVNRFYGHGLYILDEPEAALSPSKQLSLISKIYELIKLNSQFIIATHSPILMAFPNANIYVMDDTGAHLTDYKETEQYYITRQFLENPGKMLREIIS